MNQQISDEELTEHIKNYNNDFLINLLSEKPEYFHKFFVVYSCLFKNIEFLEFLIYNFVKPRNATFFNETFDNCLEYLDKDSYTIFMKSQYSIVNNGAAFYQFCFNNKLDIIKIILSHKEFKIYKFDMFYKLANDNNIELIDFLIKHPKVVVRDNSFDIIISATKLKQIEALKYFLDNKNPWSYDSKDSTINRILTKSFTYGLDSKDAETVSVFVGNELIMDYFKQNNKSLYNKYRAFYNSNNF